MYNHKKYKEAWGRQQINVDQILQREQAKQQSMQMQGLQGEDEKTLEELEAEIAEMESSLGLASGRISLLKTSVTEQQQTILSYLKQMKVQYGNLDISCKMCGEYQAKKRYLQALVDQKKQQSPQ